MAKKKAPDTIPGFDAIAASRRWRVNAGRRLAKMTPSERREHLRRTTEAFFAVYKPKKRKTA
jgi:hypothetical protein